MPQIARDLEVGDTSGSISLMRAREPGTAVSRIMTVVVRTGRATRPVLERTLELMKKMDCMCHYCLSAHCPYLSLQVINVKGLRGMVLSGISPQPRILEININFCRVMVLSALYYQSVRVRVYL